MANILVAVICNLVAALILFSGIFSAVRNNWRISLSKFIIMIAGGVGCYFAVPALSNTLLDIAAEGTTVSAILSNLGVSLLTINSVIFTVLFLVWYAIDLMICNIIKHCLIKSYRNKSENKAKMKRAKSINPKAEKLARRAAWREMKAEYRANNNFWKRLLSGFIGGIVAVVVGLIVLMPFGYIGEDMNKASGGNKQYLETGFDYTLNGLIDEKIDFKFFDWLVSAEEKAPEANPDEEEQEGGEESQTPCEQHEFVDGVCIHCQEPEGTGVTE